MRTALFSCVCTVILGWFLKDVGGGENLRPIYSRPDGLKNIALLLVCVTLQYSMELYWLGLGGFFTLTVIIHSITIIHGILLTLSLFLELSFLVVSGKIMGAKNIKILMSVVVLVWRHNFLYPSGSGGIILIMHMQ